MSEKRRDSKNRILHNGESQRKDGRYMYKYTDADGEAKYFYSWKLDKNDVTPKGKPDEVSLREKERELERKRLDGIAFDNGKITVLKLVEKYVSLKTGVRHNTEANYKFAINVIKKEAFGRKLIDRIKKSDAKEWLIKLQKDGRGYSSIHVIRGVVRPAFQMAVDDDLIRKNPFDFTLSTVVVNDMVTREAISPDEMNRFLTFVKEDEHYCRYYDGMFVLFHTGLRVSEFVGLTVRDIDFENMVLHVTHQLQRKRNMEYSIEPTKTSSGTRDIPMTKEVAESFRRIIRSRKRAKIEPMIGGYSEFLFLDKNDMPMVALHWEKYFQFAVAKYNRYNKVQLPKITPHVCRHTFCSNMARSGMNPKTLQYIMGHSDIGVTLNTYTHLSFEDAKEEMARLCAAGL